MKNVIMFVTGITGTEQFDTVKEAQEYAATLTEGDEFSIFTLYTKGTRAGIVWKTQTDTATNLREIKKSKRSGAWSILEEDTLMSHYKSKMPIKQIAEKLGRSYNACYCKVHAIKRREKKDE